MDLVFVGRSVLKLKVILRNFTFVIVSIAVKILVPPMLQICLVQLQS